MTTKMQYFAIRSGYFVLLFIYLFIYLTVVGLHEKKKTKRNKKLFKGSVHSQIEIHKSKLYMLHSFS